MAHIRKICYHDCEMRAPRTDEMLHLTHNLVHWRLYAVRKARILEMLE